MIAWWRTLSLRDKQITALCTISFSLFLIYKCLWAPFTDAIDHLRETIPDLQNTLQSIKNIDHEIAQLQTIIEKHPNTATTTLLSIVQKQLNNSPLSAHVTALQQLDNNTVSITLDKINFDTLMAWLIALWQQQGIVISQFSAAQNGPPGTVAASFILAT